MGEMNVDVIHSLVVETLAEQQRIHHNDIEAVVVRAIATILTSFGIEEEDRRELRADFQHLRRWRKSVEQAQSFTFKAVIAIIVSGFVGAVWLGVKHARQMIMTSIVLTASFTSSPTRAAAFCRMVTGVAIFCQIAVESNACSRGTSDKKNEKARRCLR